MGPKGREGPSDQDSPRLASRPEFLHRHSHIDKDEVGLGVGDGVTGLAEKVNRVLADLTIPFPFLFDKAVFLPQRRLGRHHGSIR